LIHSGIVSVVAMLRALGSAASGCSVSGVSSGGGSVWNRKFKIEFHSETDAGLMFGSAAAESGSVEPMYMPE
jgi:hypothetical protein